VHRPSQATGWALVLLALALPFETFAPLLRLPGMGLTSLELVTLPAVALLGAQALRRPGFGALARDHRVRFVVGFVGLAFLAGFFAEQDRALGLKSALRWGVGGTLFIGARVAFVAANGRLWRHTIVALVAGGIVASLLALGGLAGVRPWPVELFGPGLSWFGPYARATGTSLTANALGHYLVILLPLALGLASERPRWLVVVALFSIVLALTLSRAAMVVAVVLAAFWPFVLRRGIGSSVGGATASLMVVVSMVAVVFAYPPLRLRLGYGDMPTFHVHYDVPARLAALAGSALEVPVRLSARSRDASPGEGVTALEYSYRRLVPSARRHRGAVVRFPVMNDGDERRVAATVQAPTEPGVYIVIWEAQLMGDRAMSTMGTPPAISELRVHVHSPDEIDADRQSPEYIAEQIALDQRSRVSAMDAYLDPPGRRELWRAALALVARHPLLGVGPDHFRLMSRMLVGPTHDPRMSAHNILLELGADLGLPALALFLILVFSVAIPLARGLATGRPLENREPLLALGGVVASLGHNIVDYFLGFTAMYVLFFLLLALASALRT
jgi:O-antigen ligase